MDNIVRAEHVTVNYGDNCALENISLSVAAGEYLGVIGPNGGGKTTLLKAILGLVPVQSGSISVCGQPAGRSGTLVGYVPQFSRMEKNFPVTVRDVVLSGRLMKRKPLFHRYDKADFKAAEDAMDEVQIAELSARQISGLSGGEFQRMLIARALAVGPKLLLLDEPTASVDAGSRAQIYKLLASLNQRGMTVMLVTHDTMAVSSQVHRIACLNRTLVYHGEPELSEKTLDTLYGCPVDLIAHGVPHRVLRTHGEEE